MKRLDSTIDTGNLEARNTTRRPRRKKGARSSNSYLGLGRSLGSDRDRQRLQERNAAERSRVERMLAEGPSSLGASFSLPTQPPARWNSSHPVVTPPVSTRPSRSRLRARPTTQTAARGWACPVCASGKVVSDEVAHGGTLRLSECLHCDHRWTERTRARWSELGHRMSGGERRRPGALPAGRLAPTTAAATSSRVPKPGGQRVASRVGPT